MPASPIVPKNSRPKRALNPGSREYSARLASRHCGLYNSGLAHWATETGLFVMLLAVHIFVLCVSNCQLFVAVWPINMWIKLIMLWIGSWLRTQAVVIWNCLYDICGPCGGHVTLHVCMHYYNYCDYLSKWTNNTLQPYVFNDALTMLLVRCRWNN